MIRCASASLAANRGLRRGCTARVSSARRRASLDIAASGRAPRRRSPYRAGRFPAPGCAASRRRSLPRWQGRARRRRGPPGCVHAVGDVVDETGRQADQRAVIVHGRVEPSITSEKPAREHEIADARVVKVDRASRAPILFVEPTEPRRDGRARPGLDRGQLRRSRCERVDERGEVGLGRAVGQATIEQIDQRRRARPAKASQARGVLAKVRRP